MVFLKDSGNKNTSTKTIIDFYRALKENNLQEGSGKIVQITGPVVDVKFAKEYLPKIKERLYVECKKEERSMEVVQHIGNYTARCVMLDASEGLCRDMEVHATGKPICVPVGEAVLGRALNVLGKPIDDGERPIYLRLFINSIGLKVI